MCPIVDTHLTHDAHLVDDAFHSDVLGRSAQIQDYGA
jgi:hypothetical protein